MKPVPLEIAYPVCGDGTTATCSKCHRPLSEHRVGRPHDWGYSCQLAPGIFAPYTFEPAPERTP